MSRVSSRTLVLAAGLAAVGALPAAAATGGGEVQQISAAGMERPLGDAADLMLRFVQEDGPESGHVRVLLTPETRPLTMIEARMAAEKGFFAALNEPGLGGNLSRVTVVVKMMPPSHPDPEAIDQVIIYQHKAGNDWSVLPGE